MGFASTRSHLDQRSTDEGSRSTSAWLRSPVLAAAAVLFLACAAGLFWWKTGSRSTGAARSSGGSAVQTQATPSQGATDAGIGPYQINAKFHAVKKNGREAVLRPGAIVEPGDMLYLTVETSMPTYVYVVNQDDKGESLLEYPLPDQNVANPLPAGTVNRIPGRVGTDEYYWQVTSEGGREHFYVVASPERLVAFEKTVAALPRPRYDQPVLPLTREAVGMLRSVGGLAKAAPAPGGAASLLIPFATPLLETAETVRGYWAREITLENPIKKP